RRRQAPRARRTSPSSGRGGAAKPAGIAPFGLDRPRFRNYTPGRVISISRISISSSGRSSPPVVFAGLREVGDLVGFAVLGRSEGRRLRRASFRYVHPLQPFPLQKGREFE